MTTAIDVGPSTIRDRLSRFLNLDSRYRSGVRTVVRLLGDVAASSFVFGGLLRDLMSPRSERRYRDIDVVVDGLSVSELEEIFSPYVRRRTRFGGLRLNVEGWAFDVWPLEETWAFREGIMLREADFEGLTRTTFLNVEAVVAALVTDRGSPREVFASGFFEAFRDGVLDINLERNPFPALCVVRSFVTAVRLEFQLSGRLSRYLVEVSEDCGLQALVEAGRSHYGYDVVTRRELEFWLHSVERQLREDPDGVASLPVSSERQLQLWDQASSG